MLRGWQACAPPGEATAPRPAKLLCSANLILHGVAKTPKVKVPKGVAVPHCEDLYDAWWHIGLQYFKPPSATFLQVIPAPDLREFPENPNRRYYGNKVGGMGLRGDVPSWTMGCRGRTTMGQPLGTDMS